MKKFKVVIRPPSQKRNLLEGKLDYHNNGLLTYIGAARGAMAHESGEELLIFKNMEDYNANKKSRIDSSAPEKASVYVIGSGTIEKKVEGKNLVFLLVKYYRPFALVG